MKKGATPPTSPACQDGQINNQGEVEGGKDIVLILPITVTYFPPSERMKDAVFTTNISIVARLFSFAANDDDDERDSTYVFY